jgi:DNA invertase Pin-like site-specific DNA recombinase
MKVGYVRVSSTDQNEERQVVALVEHGVEKFFIEKVSGKDRNRPQLKEMLSFVREGDVLYIESISRLARNTLDFLSIVKELQEKGVEIVSLKENIDTATPQGRFMLTIFGAMYEMERETIKERQREGIDIALAKGVKFGRPKKEITEKFISIYRKWKAGELTATAAMKQLGMKPNTFYRRVKEYEQQGA